MARNISEVIDKMIPILTENNCNEMVDELEKVKKSSTNSSQDWNKVGNLILKYIPANDTEWKQKVYNTFIKE